MKINTILLDKVVRAKDINVGDILIQNERLFSTYDYDLISSPGEEPEQDAFLVVSKDQNWIHTVCLTDNRPLDISVLKVWEFCFLSRAEE